MSEKPAYTDLADMTEDERINVIGHVVTAHAKTVGVFVDDDDAKVARYIRKLRARFPTLVVLSQEKGPTPGVVTIKVGPQQN